MAQLDPVGVLFLGWGSRDPGKCLGSKRVSPALFSHPPVRHTPQDTCSLAVKKQFRSKLQQQPHLGQVMSLWSLVAVGMDPWWALWLILTLPQILEGQDPTMPRGFSQMTSFQSNKV